MIFSQQTLLNDILKIVCKTAGFALSVNMSYNIFNLYNITARNTIFNKASSTYLLHMRMDILSWNIKLLSF